MNLERRKEIDDLIRRASASKGHLITVVAELLAAHAVLEMLHTSVTKVKAQEQAYLDNMPEAFQAANGLVKVERLRGSLEGLAPL